MFPEESYWVLDNDRSINQSASVIGREIIISQKKGQIQIPEVDYGVRNGTTFITANISVKGFYFIISFMLHFLKFLEVQCDYPSAVRGSYLSEDVEKYKDTVGVYNIVPGETYNDRPVWKHEETEGSL